MGWRGVGPRPHEKSDSWAFAYVQDEVACGVITVDEDEVAFPSLNLDLNQRLNTDVIIIADQFSLIALAQAPANVQNRIQLRACGIDAQRSRVLRTQAKDPLLASTCAAPTVLTLPSAGTPFQSTDGNERGILAGTLGMCPPRDRLVK